MLIDEVIAKTSIELPKPLSLAEAEDLIDYIAMQLPANVNYHSSYHRSITHVAGEDGEWKDRVLKEDGTAEVTVSISHLEKSLAFDTFQLKCSQEDYSRLGEIIFTRTPDWDINEYRPEVQQLWDDTRKIVEQYFEEKDA
jgi:hypothetical protein